MTTTQTTEKTVLEIRWDAAIFSPERANDGSISWATSKRYDRITETLEELAAMLDEEGVWGEERDALNEMTGAIWEDIRRHLCAYVEAGPSRRDAIRAKWREEEKARVSRS